MPGLFGMVSQKRECLETQMAILASSMQAHGQYYSDFWIDQAGGVGFGREASHSFIRDQQPVCSPDGIRLMIHGQVCNGNDFMTTSSTDYTGDNKVNRVQSVLEKYLREGVGALASVNGGISSVVWNPGERTLILVPDRFGLRPLFYYYFEDEFVFASEIKTLIALQTVPLTLDEPAVMEYLAMDQIGHDRTFFRWIRRVPFGSVLTFKDGNISITESSPMVYHQPTQNRTDADYLDEFVELSRSAVECRLEAIDTIIALSGGLDSRFLTALALRNGKKPVTVTYGQKGSRDVMRARSIAKQAGLKNYTLILKENYLIENAESMVWRVDGLFNAFTCHGIVLTEIADRFSTVVLGNGLDQILYAARSEHHDLNSGMDIGLALFKNRNSYIAEPDWNGWFTQDWLKQVGNSVKDNFLYDLNRIQTDSLDNLIDSYMLNLYAVGVVSGLPMITHKMEFTEPFYDASLVNLLLNAPLHLRWKRKLEIDALKAISPELSKISGGPLYHPSTLEKFQQKLLKKEKNLFARLGIIKPIKIKPPSSTFTDMHNLLRTPINHMWLESILFSKQSLERGIIQPDTLRSTFDQHMQGEFNHTKALSVLVTLELFFRRFIDRDMTLPVIGN